MQAVTKEWGGSPFGIGQALVEPAEAPKLPSRYQIQCSLGGTSTREAGPGGDSMSEDEVSRTARECLSKSPICRTKLR